MLPYLYMAVRTAAHLHCPSTCERLTQWRDNSDIARVHPPCPVPCGAQFAAPAPCRTIMRVSVYDVGDLTIGSGRWEKSSFWRTSVTTEYEVVGGRSAAGSARAFGDEKSRCPSDQRGGGGGMGLLLRAAGGARGGVTGTSSMAECTSMVSSDVRTRLRASVGDPGGDDGGDDARGDGSSVGAAGCVCFLMTARGRRNFTSVPSSR